MVNAANYADKTGPKDDNYSEVMRILNKYKKVICELRERLDSLSKT